MTDNDLTTFAFALALIVYIALVLLFFHLRREISVYRMFGAAMPGIIIIFGLYAYIVLGFALTTIFWASLVIMLGSAAYIVSFMRGRRYVREHVPAIKERQKNYWKKRILSEQAKGYTPLLLQKRRQLPSNDELIEYGFDDSDLRGFGLRE